MTLWFFHTGTFRPTLQWFKDNVPINRSNRMTPRGGTLTLRELGSSDTGLYTCRVTTELGTKTTESNLKVLGKFRNFLRAFFKGKKYQIAQFTEVPYDRRICHEVAVKTLAEHSHIDLLLFWSGMSLEKKKRIISNFLRWTSENIFRRIF